jgi:hypothetical protein
VRVNMLSSELPTNTTFSTDTRCGGAVQLERRDGAGEE